MDSTANLLIILVVFWDFLDFFIELELESMRTLNFFAWSFFKIYFHLANPLKAFTIIPRTCKKHSRAKKQDKCVPLVWHLNDSQESSQTTRESSDQQFSHEVPPFFHLFMCKLRQNCVLTWAKQIKSCWTLFSVLMTKKEQIQQWLNSNNYWRRWRWLWLPPIIHR